jgi:Tfp pilus assembly protein PilF
LAGLFDRGKGPIALNPAFAGTYDRLGDAYTRAGKFEEAQRMLQRAIVLDPNSTGPYIQLGKVLLKKNDAKTALMYLERAVKMDPTNFITHHLLGQAYRGVGQESDAEREFKRAEELQRENPVK